MKKTIRQFSRFRRTMTPSSETENSLFQKRCRYAKLSYMQSILPHIMRGRKSNVFIRSWSSSLIFRVKGLNCLLMLFQFYLNFLLVFCCLWVCAVNVCSKCQFLLRAVLSDKTLKKKCLTFSLPCHEKVNRIFTHN